VLIIGAGINGCGTFRDLALQGIDCLLIDRGDICEGASAAPSRLIHGGIKYLETGEFRLVRESAMERNRLLRKRPSSRTAAPSSPRSAFASMISITARYGRCPITASSAAGVSAPNTPPSTARSSRPGSITKAASPMPSASASNW